MSENIFNDLFYDPLLPDLIPEGPAYDTMINLDEFTMPMSHPELADLTRKFETLNIDSNTHGLRIEIERTKRQRLQAIVKRVKHELHAACADITTLREEINQFREQQNAVNFQLNNENIRTNTLAFRCLSRIGQILTLGPLNAQPVDNYNELEVLLQELHSTVRHFGVYYASSYV